LGLFKKIGRGLKNAFDAVGDTVDKAIDGVGDAAGWVADKVGDVTEGVTRVVAGDKAADKVGKVFDERIEPAINRGIQGFATLSPLGWIGAIDDIAEKGIIDGIVQHGVEGAQDLLGSTTRLIGGEKAEQKFDKVFDDKIQKWVQLAAGTAARAGLLFVPGGQLALLADFGSELGSLGYRAANDEKLGVFDYLGAAESLITVGTAGLGTAALTGAKTAGNVALNSVDDVAKVGVNVADDVAKAGVNVSDDVAKIGANVSDDVGTGTAKTGLQAAALQGGTSGQIAGRIGTEVGADVALGVGITKIIEHRNRVKQNNQAPDVVGNQSTETAYGQPATLAYNQPQNFIYSQPLPGAEKLAFNPYSAAY
jgi:hypothetical protein